MIGYLMTMNEGAEKVALIDIPELRTCEDKTNLQIYLNGKYISVLAMYPNPAIRQSSIIEFWVIKAMEDNSEVYMANISQIIRYELLEILN